MGYRNYIALLDRKKHNEIKDMTYSQLQKWYGDEYVPCYKLASEVHEIGKYWDCDFMDKLKQPIFTRPSTDKRFNEDGEFYAINKDALKVIIESYRDKVVAYYESLLNPSERDKLLGDVKTPEIHVKQQLSLWSEKRFTPYNLDLSDQNIVNSWQYEHAIFELVRLYKTIDENEHIICITGW